MADTVFMNKMLLIAIVLVIIGALNWGWIGLTSNNLVASLNNATFRNDTFARIVYILIGVAGLYLLYHHISNRPRF